MGQALDALKRSKQLRVIGKKYSPERLRKCLDTLAKLPVIKEGCRQAGFSIGSLEYYIARSEQGAPGFVITWRDVEAPFHELLQHALVEGLQCVEAEAFKRATGYKEVLTDRGRVVYKEDPTLLALGLQGHEAYLLDKDNKPIPETIDMQSEDLMKFILGARDPRYRPKQQIEIEDKRTVIVVGVVAKSSKELEDREKAAQEAAPLDVEFREVEAE